ncbi:hypothetical protein F4774DRAFT_429038 [Daldinia eschscholtzii]|nr:hypothetical protein F4774DRAFT_429038 [Daldinia eschscholtzii]
MMDQNQLEIIKNNPIGNDLDDFYLTIYSVCKINSILCSPEAPTHLNQEDINFLVLVLLFALQSLPITGILLFNKGHGTLRNNLLRVASALPSNPFDGDCFKLLLAAIIAKKPDEVIWSHVYHAVTEYTVTLPPKPIAFSFQQISWLRHTDSFVDSFEHRKYVGEVLKGELGLMYVGLPNFYETYFGSVADLTIAADVIFKRCTKGGEPVFGKGGWSGWPQDANQDGVLNWFISICDKLATLAEEHNPTRASRRRLVQSSISIQSATGEQKIDVGFIRNDEVIWDGKCHWSQILIHGELKSNPSADTASKAWLDIGKYSQKILLAQDTRRFAIGFTLCGSSMRIWLFDRIGGIASDQFDVNKDGRRFVYTILGFFWMDETQLGFDPTIITSGSERYIEIDRNGRRERLIIDRVIMRTPYIAGRATTCWKARSETDLKTPLVIKDSWQDTEREEEGELLREATTQNINNMARYYHHYTVQVYGADDDIQNNVRKGLNVTTAQNYCPQHSMIPREAVNTSNYQESRSITLCRKRFTSQIDTSLPFTKRLCSASSTKANSNDNSNNLPNRIHRRLIVRDYGKPIYKASSHAALLKALEGCIAGHESLHRAGILHRDISVNNLMINEDDSNPSWSSFLIDLDLAIKEERNDASEAKNRMGTRAFMAIGALEGEQHSFMHDLESFFWVLFWICIHDDGPREKKERLDKVVLKYDKWNYINMDDLADAKIATIVEKRFRETMANDFTEYYQSLASLVNELRKVVFPGGRPWEKNDEKLYFWMKDILRKGWEKLDE